VANLYVLYRLVRDGPLLSTPALRVPCLALAAFLPQFVLFGNYVSNDALAFLLGSSLVLQSRAYVTEPPPRRLKDLGLLLGLGLLTKLTFVAYAPCLLGLVFLTERRRGWRRALAFVLVLGLVAGAVGSYKPSSTDGATRTDRAAA
jgi:4-amino-4-deoxy-L-arabinose transferase-like glycosyltransferase